MKKKNLIILLLMPFLISVFCIITINATYNMIDVDISGIDWSYKDMEGFQLPSTAEGYKGIKLVAQAVNQRNYAVSGGNALIWSVENKDPSDTDPCAEIVVDGDTYYLIPIKEGEIIITCSNEKGNVQRRLSAVVYKDAAIMLYAEISASQSNIDPVIYYGEYDHTVGNYAKFKVNLAAVGTDRTNLTVETSNNISYDKSTETVSIHGTGSAYLKVSDPSGLAKTASYDFFIVDEGVNVYNYADLLYCTNSSTGGHIAVLRKHFESLENVYQMNGNHPVTSGGVPVRKNSANNVECFGNYDPLTKSFSFDKEIYSFTTTYNRNFIDGWNSFAEENAGYSKISDQIYVGLHVQKDFYGNGYTVNLHNLTYPYTYSVMLNDSGKEVQIPVLTAANLYRGPLKLYSLGDPNNVPLVSLYGQDNIGMYVHGNGITVNDVNLKNCDFGDRMANLDTVGTVLENYGHNNTVKNSKISNGKNVVRSFSSENFTLANSLLSNARNFLFVTGSNEYEQVNLDKEITYPNLMGGTVKSTVGEFLSEGSGGDEILSMFIKDFFSDAKSREAMRKALETIQSSLSEADKVRGNYKGSSTITDTYFYRSGITAICMETMFNSSFLETGTSPSLIKSVFALLQSEGKTLVPYVPQRVSGVSYPVKLEVNGNTRFYDYKEVGSIDLSGLIEENVSAIANSLDLYEGTITIDDIFPLQKLISDTGHTYTSDGKKYYNIPVAYYGGGLNLSTVRMNIDNITDKNEVDLLNEYLRLQGSSGGLTGNTRGLMLKTVVTVTGFEPFAFHYVKNGYLFGETPNLSDLVGTAKRAN